MRAHIFSRGGNLNLRSVKFHFHEAIKLWIILFSRVVEYGSLYVFTVEVD